MAIVNNPAKFQLDKPDSETNGAPTGTRRTPPGATTSSTQHARAAEDHPGASSTRRSPRPCNPRSPSRAPGCQTAGGSAYFCDYVKNILQNDPIFGEDAETRMLNFRRGGYDVYTTLDLDLQSAAESAIAQNVPQTYPGWDVGGVISSVQVGTGRVLAMAQNSTTARTRAVLHDGSAVHEHQLQHRLRLRRVERVPARVVVQGVHARRSG